MSLMTEYAITPAVFDAMHFSGNEIIESNFALLKESLFNEGIVRNLYGGEWLNVFKDPTREWHQKGKELLKKLIKQNRLRCHPPSQLPFPGNDHDWCKEALLSSDNLSLGGLVTTLDTAALYPKTHPLIATIGKLSSAPWWSRRGSTRLCRNSASYLEHLRLVLECSRSLMFIDRNLNPARRSYREFIKIIEPLKSRELPPSIEIHRTAYASEGAKGRVTYSIDEWKKIFSDAFSEFVRQTDINIKVFIWHEMHDRYLISDIFGILAPNGFDISNKPAETTTWASVSRPDRDDIAREYDPACNRLNFVGQFEIK